MKMLGNSIETPTTNLDRLSGGPSLYARFNVVAVLVEWRRRRAFRRDLTRLLSVGRYMIRDIGLSPEEALRESRKPFWKA